MFTNHGSNIYLPTKRKLKMEVKKENVTRNNIVQRLGNKEEEIEKGNVD